LGAKIDENRKMKGKKKREKKPSTPN